MKHVHPSWLVPFRRATGYVPAAAAAVDPAAPRLGVIARLGRRIGPGLITGVADDDPSGIATYSQAGAQFGLNMLWTMPFCYPLMSAVQMLCGMIGRVTGKGLATNIKASFGAPALAGIVALLLFANVINIGADVAAMGEAAETVTGWSRHGMAIGLTAMMLMMIVFVPYREYVRYLKWLTLSLLAYVAVLFTVHVPWGQVALRTVWPRISWNADYLTVVVGVFGTTISPYLFFWQASEEVQDLEEKGGRGLVDSPEDAPAEFSRIGWDTWAGMFYSNLTAILIILASAVTLNVAGVTDIQTAAQAASALKPLAGPLASLIFTLGILGVGLLAVPVLAGSAAYAVAELMGWRWGLEHKPDEATGFYAVIAGMMVAGLLLGYAPVNPIKALFWSAVVNGVVAVPLIVIVVLLASRRSVMGPFVANKWLTGLGWLTALLMGAAAVCMFVL